MSKAERPRLLSLEAAAMYVGLSKPRLSKLAQMGRIKSEILSSGRSRYCQRFFLSTVLEAFKISRTKES